MPSAPPILARVTITEPLPGFLSLGQATARRTLLNGALRGRLQRTLLVHGPAGAGKAAFVDDLLALLFCASVDPAQRPCNACSGCRRARARTHPDLVVGSPERWREERSAGESIVAAARRWLLANAGAPVEAERRVTLIEEADRTNEQTQSALLKVLEEPGPRQMFVLVADEPARLLPTIRSRVQAVRVGAVPRPQLVEWLTERRQLPEDQADSLARIAEGLQERALDFVDHPERLAWWRQTQLELLDLLERGPADRFGSIRDLLTSAARLQAGPVDEGDGESEPVAGAAAEQRAGALRVIEAWLGLARDLAVAGAGRPALAPGAGLHPQLPTIAPRIDQRELVAFIEHLEATREALRQNVAPILAMQAAMLTWPTIGTETR